MLTLVLNVVDNPLNAIFKANFIGVLAWSIGLGLALRHASDATKQVVADFAEGISKIVHVIISFAPFGVFGLVAETLSRQRLICVRWICSLIIRVNRYNAIYCLCTLIQFSFIGKFVVIHIH